MQQTLRSMVWLAVFSLLNACRGISLASSTPTPVPIEKRDLSKIVIQPGEFPPDFHQLNVEDISKVFTNVKEVHEGILGSYVIYSRTDDMSRVYSSGVMVYADVETAAKVYQAIIDNTHENTAMNVEPIGDRSYAMLDIVSHEAMANDIHIGMILWTYHSAVMYISGADNQKPPSLQEMTRLAQKVQARLTSPGP